MKKLILLSIAVLFISKSYAGIHYFDDSTYTFNRFTYFEGGLGGTCLISESSDENFNWGLCGNFRMRFDTKSRKLSFSPQVGFRQYTTSLENNNEVDENLSIINLGLQVNFSIFQTPNKKFALSNILELKYSWMFSNFAWDIENGYATTTETLDLYKGRAFSVLLGYRIRYSIAYLEIGYDLLESKVKLSDELIQEYEQNQIAYNPEPRFGFNSVNITLGLSIPLKDAMPSRLLW